MYTLTDTTTKQNQTDNSLHKRDKGVVRTLPAVPALQKKENKTGLPDNLKTGVENLSGFSMDDVKVHYNSDKPAQVKAYAYAQGTDIHVAPGQEKHVPHEAWHVAQQKQGRVQPTMQMKENVPVNDDTVLEKEADTMGEKAAQLKVDAVAFNHKTAVTTNVIQRNSFEDFDTYEDAKAATNYADALLDKQKDDPISDHFKKGFDTDQQIEIYKVNKKRYGSENIVSDSDGTTELFKPDTKTLAHIDHRFPKSKGGTNHYTNAAVIAAQANIKKSDKLEIDEEPTKPLEPYKFLALDSAFSEGKVSKGKDFSAEQRKAILDANKTYYGDVTDDADKKTTLSRIDTTRVPHIDHITAKAEGGTNYYFNATVLPASENIKKSGKKGQNPDLDYEIGEMSLVKYYKKKSKGELRFGSAIEQHD